MFNVLCISLVRAASGFWVILLSFHMMSYYMGGGGIRYYCFNQCQDFKSVCVLKKYQFNRLFDKTLVSYILPTLINYGLLILPIFEKSKICLERRENNWYLLQGVLA